MQWNNLNININFNHLVSKNIRHNVLLCFINEVQINKFKATQRSIIEKSFKNLMNQPK